MNNYPAIALNLGDITVRQHNGLFSLNDLHKASGGNPNQRPGEFIRNQQTKELVEEISNAGISAFESRKGSNGGTYACRELVIAYAAWISAAFHLKVIRVFLAAVQPQRPHNPALDYDRISPAQAQDLKELVHAVVDAKVQGFGETWARLHRKFRVNSYLELPATKFNEARDYLLGKLPEAQHKPVNDSERIALAHSVAAEVAAQASRTVFQALLATGASDWQHERWMFSMGYDRDSRKVLPWAAAIDRDALVASLPRLAQMISEPNGILPSDTELANLASACTQRLAQRAASRARAVSIA